MLKRYPEELFDEIKLLSKFPDETQLEGIKIHHEADETIRTSARSLFDKGMISQMDGGYLTPRGQETLEHLHIVLDALKP
ncbi:MAG: TIGR02647 family protein [Gammaproteobacteria bacterium]|nr:TIGR02647 family protein [Gammaproteobacteria bacterium]